MKNKILAVDDSRMMLRILSGAVEMLGYEPVTAQNGQEALEQLQNHGDEVALIMLDWNMPVMNGLELIWKLRRMEHITEKMELMVVTTHDELDDALVALNIGYLTKPFTNEQLEQKLKEIGILY